MAVITAANTKISLEVSWSENGQKWLIICTGKKKRKKNPRGHLDAWVQDTNPARSLNQFCTSFHGAAIAYAG